MTSKKIAVIGECMIELSQKGNDLNRGFGGDTLNTAVYIARQVDEEALEVHYVTALGTDSFSEDMLAAWQKEKVKIDLIQRMDDKLPGLYFIETDETGERTFYYWRNDAAARFWLTGPQADKICQKLENFDYLYLSGISLAILDASSRQRLLKLLQACRTNGGKVIFDNNYRPRLWQSKEETQEAYRAMLSCTDTAFLTLDDEDMLWGEMTLEQAIDRTQALGVNEIVIKRGADSCIVWNREPDSQRPADQHVVPAVTLPKEKVVDTTAAGDSFSAGYLAVRLTGGTPQQAAVRGHLTASTVIQYRGAIIPIAAMPKV
ncbi:sugar kinase [Yersinia sp. J1]|uniref:sugar kinase n=1 Tax=Yersinia sp. J1 TaxID=3424774 RepID=UPI003D36C91A